jgi:predicted MFS family arabinose efflux permease
VPYAKSRLGFDEAKFGLLLLAFGGGSVIAMPLAGGTAARLGSRIVILCGALAIALALPFLALAARPWELAAALFVFGAALGAVDVAVNIHGVEVEHRAGVPMMSNFHGFYSVGTLMGAAAMLALLSSGLRPSTAAFSATACVLACLAVAAPRLLAVRPLHETPFFVRPRGQVLLLGAFTFIMFLIEGALLDWGAVFLKEIRHVPAEHAGLGFSLFSAAMVAGRFTGDRITARWGIARVLFFGSLLTAFGLAWLTFLPSTLLAYFGFLLVGLGASNLVPLFFSLAGRQRAMPKDMAISAISIIGYAGILAGPASIGFLAHATSLKASFALLAAAALAMAFAVRLLTRRVYL